MQMDSILGSVFEAELLVQALAAAAAVRTGSNPTAQNSGASGLSSYMKVNGVDGLEVRVKRCNAVIGAQSQMVDVLVVSERGYANRFIIPPQQRGERIMGLYPRTESYDGRPAVGFYEDWAGIVSVNFVSGKGIRMALRNAYYDLRTGAAVNEAALFGSLRQA